MATKTRLEKAINGLKGIIQRHEGQDKFIFSNDKFIIDNSSSHFGPVLLILGILVLPVAIVVYYILTGQASAIIFWLLLFEIILIIDFYKLVRGAATLTIDFKNKYIQTDHALTRLKRIFPSQTFTFSELSQVLLKERTVSSPQEWVQLIVYSGDNKTLVLTDFSRTYPDSLIADKVRFLIEVIIWTEGQKRILAG